MPILKPQRGSLIVPGHPLARGLAGCWLMNEGCGNILYDISVGRITGSIPATTSWTATSMGSAVVGNGTGIDCGQPKILGGQQYATVSGWIYLPATSVSGVDRVWQWTGAGVDVGALGTTTNEDWAAILYDAGGTGVTALQTVGAAVIGWHFIALTLDGINLRLYVDGVQTAQQAWTGGPIGTAVSAGNNCLLAVAVDPVTFVSIWHRALSAIEISSLYSDPYQMFRSQPIELWAAATAGAGGVTYEDMAGQIDAVASLSGGLRGFIKSMAGETASVSGLDGNLTRIRSVAGQVNAVSGMSAGLACIRSIAGQIGGTSGLSGGLARIRSIAGSVDAAASLSGGLRGFIKAIAGSVEGVSDLSASLDVDTGYTLEEYNDDSNSYAGDTYGTRLHGQTFSSASGFNLVRASFLVYRVGSPGNAVLSLYATSGGVPSGSPLASATVSANTWTTSTSGEWIDWDILTPAAIEASTAYAIVLSCPDGNSSNYGRIRARTSNVYANGMLVYNTTGTWVQAGSADCAFRTYSGAAGPTYENMAGVIAASSSLAGVLYGTSRLMSGEINTTGGMVGTLWGTYKALAGVIAAAGGLSGTLSTPVFVDMAGAAGGVSTFAAALEVNVLMSGTIVAVSALSARMTRVILRDVLRGKRRLVACGNDQFWYEEV